VRKFHKPHIFSSYGPVMGFCQHGNELSGIIKAVNFMTMYLNKDCSVWSYLASCSLNFFSIPN
jgi:hypothetical protein